MKKLIVISIILFFASLNSSAQTQQQSDYLTFNISGFADNSGQVLVQLFRTEDNVPTKPFKVLKAKIVNEKAIVIVENLSFGDYAAIIVHDKNSNGIIDHRLGIPNEPLGYTNNWHLSLFSGMPTFNKLMFTFTGSKYKYNINLNE
ncbi:MAG: DUF2141 domain-containing protein [Bacteroidales bacterium]